MMAIKYFLKKIEDHKNSDVIIWKLLFGFKTLMRYLVTMCWDISWSMYGFVRSASCLDVMLWFVLWRYCFYVYRITRKNNSARINSKERNFFEKVIIPYIIVSQNPKKIADVGRFENTQFYNLFFEGRELWTLDIDPKQQKFGAKNHLVVSVANIKEHFTDNFFDLVIMNGVFGFGLNEKNDIEKALGGVYDSLKKGGIFIFGWNNESQWLPIPVASIEALKKFKPYYFLPLKNTFISMKIGQGGKGNATYSFYIKA